MLARLFRRGGRGNRIASSLYGAIVAQARTPALYAELGVPDTIDGRFEMVVLHVAIVLRRLRDGEEEARAVGQTVFDLFCEDMDRSLRELGFGDLGVPKRMKKMAEKFYGRSAAYEAGFAGRDPAALAVTIKRIVFAGGNEAAARALAAYLTATVESLAATPTPALFAATLAWPDPANFLHAGVVA